MAQTDLVNHTHWDREWYFTTTDALVLSEQLFTEALDELEKNKHANFCLDGQTSVVDEYVEIHPEAKKRIQNLVKDGRLFVGPWYTQTDALLPDSEAILRNLIIGINDSKANYGNPMMVGYLPDTFGFNAQMPTLFRQVGIDNFVFWRGTNFQKQMNSVYFKWVGLSGKSVYAANFPFGYFTAQIDVTSKNNLSQFVKERFDPIAKFQSETYNNYEVMMPSGIDQMNIVKDMDQVVNHLNELSDNQTVISSYPDFISHLRTRQDLPTYQGELRLPTYSRVHRTIGSVRHKIKMDNFNLEQKILRRVEPLVVIARKNGVNIGNGLLIKLWKKLLECQPHDTLGGSVSDNVAIDIQHRFKEANEMADGIENIIEKKLAEYLHLSDHDVLIFNTNTAKYSGEKEISIIAKSQNIKFDGFDNAYITSSKHFPMRHHVLMMTPRGQEFKDESEYYQLTLKGNVDLPAMGYKVIHFTDSDLPLEKIENAMPSQNAKITFFEQVISFDNGKLNYQSNNIVKENFVQLVDSANDGDTYDYSPLAGDHEQVLSFNNAYVRSVNGIDKQLVVNGSSSLPKTLKDRMSDSPKYGDLSYQLTLSFSDLGIIQSELIVDNQIYSHRLRLKFNPNIDTETVCAHIQDGYVRTMNQPIDVNWNESFVEKPVNIYNFDKSVSLEATQGYFTFLGKGMKEYQYEDKSLYITLMATTSQLGKPNLAWRPGRASGDTTNQGHVMMPTPLAEELGTNNFKFALKFSNQSFSEQKTSMICSQWLSQSVSYQLQTLNLFIHRLDNKIWEGENYPDIPETFSLLDFGDSLLTSAVYPAYLDNDAYIVRIQNPTKDVVEIPKRILEKAKIVNALEEPIENNSKFIDPYDMVSLKYKF